MGGEQQISMKEGKEGGEGDEDGDEENKHDKTSEKKVFWHYSQILASHSRYVDTLLSTPLAAASTNRDNSKDNDDNNDTSTINITEISFPDISPSQWQRMVMFVTDSVAARGMTKEDAIELVILYDKYDFHTGLKLCDTILCSMFYHNEEAFKTHMHDMELLDRCVQVVVLSHEKNLKETLENGLIWLQQLFYEDYEPECVILTVDHIRKLVPVIAYHKDDPDMCNVQEAIESRLSRNDLDILSPMFPDFFVTSIQLIVARNTTLKLVNQIKITNCDQVAGIYNADISENFNIDVTCTYCREDYVYYLKKNKIGDWIIERGNGHGLFICKGSRCETLPPKAGWKKVDGMEGQNMPVLTYYRTFEGDNKVESKYDRHKNLKIMIDRISIQCTGVVVCVHGVLYIYHVK